MKRLIAASSIVVVVALTAFVPGSGRASSVATRLPAGLAAAIHARFGPGQLRSADSPTEQPQLGAAVALSADGTTALVCAPGARNGAGAVYVYHHEIANAWASSSTPTATLAGTAHGAIGGEIALSADGTTAFVGAPLFSRTGGVVFVYHVASEDAWASTSKKTATLTVKGEDISGLPVAASADGTTVVVGDPLYNPAEGALGAAQVFHVSSEDAWVSTSTPTATLSNEFASDNFAGGDAVAISGDGTTVLVSDTDFKRNTGRAYLFHVASETAWTSNSVPTATLSNASSAAHGWLGSALGLSASGTTAFLGAWAAKPGGAVDVFHVADAGTWASSTAPTAILTNGSDSRDILGDDLAVSPDGATVVAGAPFAHRGKGAVDIFHAASEAAWASSAAPTAVLSDSGSAGLGTSVASALQGATVIAGAPYVNWLTGKADVFGAADASSWLSTSTPNATLTNSALPKPLCVVPNLLKENLSAAKDDLFLADCDLGKVKRVHVTTKKSRGRIVSQSPAPKRRLRPGSRVSVEIGK